MSGVRESSAYLRATANAVNMWGVGAGEAHSHDLAAGDVALVYLGAPERLLIGRAE